MIRFLAGAIILQRSGRERSLRHGDHERLHNSRSLSGVREYVDDHR
jgi:hypothetical protein